MDKKQFWQIIKEQKEIFGENLDGYYRGLVEQLSALSTKDIMMWQQIFNEYQKLSYKEKLWAAAYVINGGCSDDGFDYFRAWLTAQGKEIFLAALHDPDSLAGYQDAREDETNFEDIMSAPCTAYFKKQGLKERDYGAFYNELDNHPLTENLTADLKAEIEYADDIDITWDEDELEAILPRLCEKFQW